MTYFKTNNILYRAEIKSNKIDQMWDGRESKTITLEMTYTEAKNIFNNGLKWSIVVREEYIDPESNETINIDSEFDNSEYNIAGIIIDNRDGTISAKMGKETELEQAVTSEESTAAYNEGVNRA